MNSLAPMKRSRISGSCQSVVEIYKAIISRRAFCKGAESACYEDPSPEAIQDRMATEL